MEKESKTKLSAFTTEHPAAVMFVFLVPSTRTFRTKVVCMLLGSFCFSARKNLSLVGS